MARDASPSAESGTSEQRRLFISYKRDIEPDNSLAEFLCEALASQGLRVFIDFNIPLGHRWPELISSEIAACDYFVVLLTKASMKPGSVVVAETLLASEKAAAGRPTILPVRVAFTGRLPLDLSAAIDHLQYFEWHDSSDNDRLLGALLQGIGTPDAPSSRLLRGDHFIITETVWQSAGQRESLAGTTIVPVTAAEEATLAVTRATRPGLFGARILEDGGLEVAIWAEARYRAVQSQRGKFVKMFDNDSHTWCFARYMPDEPIALKRPDGRRDPIVVTCDQDVVRATWMITHKRGAKRESFLIVLK